MIFRFANPEWLFLLLLIPVLFWLKGRVGRRAAVQFPSTRLAAQIAAFVRRRPGRWHASLRWLSLALFIVALARPQTGEELSSSTYSGVDIVMAIDLSASMWAHDFEMNGVLTDRLTVVRSVVKDFIKERKHDRIGLIAFAGVPYLVSPLTLNHDWLLRRLDMLRIGDIEDGTAIGSAIGSATNRLRDIPAKSKIIILLTDGANNSGKIDPIPAAEAAAAFDMKVYTVGVGRQGRVPYPVRLDNNGNPARDRLGNIFLRQVVSDIDLDTLQSIAETTKARYFHATNLEKLKEIYDEIDNLEKTEITVDVRKLYSEVFFYPLALGTLLLLIDVILQQTRYRRLP